MAYPPPVLSDARQAAVRRQARRLRGQPWLSLLTVALGVMLVGIDASIVAIASPAMQEHLNASLADIQWVNNSYMLALAVLLIPAGKLGDRFGHARVFLAGAAGFALASAGIGVAGNVSLIIALRVLQGVFGAMLMPTAMGVIRACFPADRLNAAIGIWGGISAASVAAGPLAGGLLVEHVNWQACFFVNIPVAAAALALGLAVLKETPRAPRGQSFDLPGVLLLTATLGTLVWGIIKAPSYGWGDPVTLACLAGSAVLAALFTWREAKAEQPLLPLRLFRSVPLSAGTVLILMLAFALFGGMFFMTFLLQNEHGLSPVSAGVHLLPLTATLIAAAPLSSLVIGRAGPRFPLAAGMALAAAGLFGLATMDAAAPVSGTIVWLVLIGAGLAPVMVAGTEVIVGNAPPELAGIAGGIQSTALELGGSLGTAVLGAVMASRVDALLPRNWAATGLPALTGPRLAQAGNAVSVGLAPVPPGTPARASQAITAVAHATFTGGLHTSFTVTGAVAIAGALIALLAKPGRKAGNATVHL